MMAIPVSVVRPLVVAMVIRARPVVNSAVAVARAVPREELAAVMISDTLGAVVKERDDLDLVRENLEEITSSG